MRNRKVTTAIIALSTTVLLAGQIQAQSTFTVREKVDFLHVHNSARREVGSPPLAWDEKLASDAQQYANYLARTGKKEHAKDRGGQGESLAWNSDKTNPVKMGATHWYNEKADFQRLGTRGKLLDAHVANNDIFKKIGHYTQMVWQDTMRVGGGKAQYPSGEWIIVGRYLKGGNYRDQYAYGTPNKSTANDADSGGTAQAKMNPGEDAEKSIHKSDTQVAIKVTNNSGQTVTCEWIDFEGKPAQKMEIQEAGYADLSSYPGHLYRFHVGGTTTNYRVSRDPVQQYSIGSPAKTDGPRGVANATPPWAANQNKSTYKQGDPQVTISVTNKTGQDLEFLWVDGNGKEAQPPGVIRARAEKHQMGTTYPGSLYRFKLNGKLLHSWVIQKDQTHLTIQSPAKTAPSTPRSLETTPLVVYWSNDNQDNYTGAEGESIAGYSAFTNVGYVLKNPVPGTRPLHVYRSNREYLTATPNAAQGILSQEKDKGYQRVKTLGYVYENRSPQGQRELRLYFNSTRGDYYTTATDAGYTLADQYGYKQLGIVGYVPATPE